MLPSFWPPISSIKFGDIAICTQSRNILLMYVLITDSSFKIILQPRSWLDIQIIIYVLRLSQQMKTPTTFINIFGYRILTHLGSSMGLAHTEAIGLITTPTIPLD